MKRLFSALFLFLFSSASVLAAASGDKVELELKELAKQVAASLKDEKTLKIGRFHGNGDLPSAFGPEIQRILLKELAALGVRSDHNAAFELSGDYRPANVDPAVPDSHLTYVRLNARIVDSRTGEPINTIVLDSRAVYGNETLGRFFATSFTVPPSADYQQENERIQKRLEKPSFKSEETRISPDENSPFAVEVLAVDRKDAPQPTRGVQVQKTGEGLPYVSIQRGQFYRLKIYNNADFESAVRICIDGIDQYAFSDPEFREPDGKPKYNYRIIPKKSSAVISGWFRSLDTFDYFVVTEYAKSASSELGRNPDEAGQVTVQFYACWESDDQKPKDEGARSASDATGREPGGKEKSKEVVRTIGGLRAEVGLRYGSGNP